MTFLFTDKQRQEARESRLDKIKQEQQYITDNTCQHEGYTIRPVSVNATRGNKSYGWELIPPADAKYMTPWYFATKQECVNAIHRHKSRKG